MTTDVTRWVVFFVALAGVLIPVSQDVALGFVLVTSAILALVVTLSLTIHAIWSNASDKDAWKGLLDKLVSWSVILGATTIGGASSFSDSVSMEELQDLLVALVQAAQ